MRWRIAALLADRERPYHDLGYWIRDEKFRPAGRAARSIFLISVVSSAVLQKYCTGQKPRALHWKRQHFSIADRSSRPQQVGGSFYRHLRRINEG